MSNESSMGGEIARHTEFYDRKDVTGSANLLRAMTFKSRGSVIL